MKNLIEGWGSLAHNPVGTLSFSHPLFGVSVLFIYYLCPQPDANHLARWVCLAPWAWPWMDVRLLIALQVLQVRRLLRCLFTARH